MEQEQHKQAWVVYLIIGQEDSTFNIVGIVYDLNDFIKLAAEKYGITHEPVRNYFGSGSLHYEYSILKGKYKE